MKDECGLVERTVEHYLEAAHNIHFGQEKSGTNDVVYNDDARDQLVLDARDG